MTNTRIKSRLGSQLLLSLHSLILFAGCGGVAESFEETPPEFGELNSALVAPLSCAIQTHSGNYLTAVGGGGRTTDVLHSDATKVGSWEKFAMVDSGDGSAFLNYGLRTSSGHYLTAVDSGGRTTDVIHSDATRLLDWEKFLFWSLGNGLYAIKTVDGHYVTAVGGGGRTTDVIHTDATRIGTWEQFRVTDCTYIF